MVYVHGGFYSFGSTAKIDAQRLGDDKDIVFVSFNYRLGLFGM